MPTPKDPRTGRPTAARKGPRPKRPARRRHRATVLVDPAAGDVSAARAHVEDLNAKLGWDAPEWVELGSSDEKIAAAAAAAAEHTQDLVCVLGGDAATRTVATAMLERGTPLGLLPTAGAHALAGSLDIPVDDIDAAYRIACTGRNRRIDVGLIRLSDTRIDEWGRVSTNAEEGSAGEHVYLATATYGGGPHDGARTVRDLGERTFHGFVALHGVPEQRRVVRRVVVGNCNELLGKRASREVARLSDGDFDVVLEGPGGLASVPPRILRILSRTSDPSAAQPISVRANLEHHTTHEVRIRSVEPRQVRVDDVLVGEAREFVAAVRRGQLTVRVPR